MCHNQWQQSDKYAISIKTNPLTTLHFPICHMDNWRGPIMTFFRFHCCMFCLYCDMFTCTNVQKGLYFSHTACAAAPLFTLCLKPEPSLLWLVSWPALLWLVSDTIIHIFYVVVVLYFYSLHKASITCLCVLGGGFHLCVFHCFSPLTVFFGGFYLVSPMI